MASRRDQVQSYQFMMRRVVSALVMREPDPAQAPPRQGLNALLAGMMIAVVVVAGFGVYGIVTKVGGDQWRADNSVVVERETGAPYVYLDGVLHPTVNYVSALLVSGRPRAEPFRVAAKALAGVPRGVPLGIPGAPNSLPRRDRVMRGPWSLCVTPETDGAGRERPITTLAIGRAAAGARVVGPDSGVLVREAASDSTFLVWRGHRYLVRAADTVLPSLYQGRLRPLDVSPAWLSALPEGADIAPIDVPNAGAASTAVPGSAVGDLLYTSTGTGAQYYLVVPGGLARVTELQRILVQVRRDVVPELVALATVNAAARAELPVAPGPADQQPPQAPPPLVETGAGEGGCVVAAPGEERVTVTVGERPPSEPGIVTGSRTADGSDLADRVLVPPGTVAVVEAMPSPSAPSGVLLVVTDAGSAYPVPSLGELGMLGFQAGDVIRLPVAFVARLPRGPALSAAAARQPASVQHGP